MWHPLEFVPQNLRKLLFNIFLVLALVIFGVFRFLDVPLQTAAAPSGIVSFELAGKVDVSQSIVDSWDMNARIFAAFGLGFDYLFMPIYALALSLGLLLVGAKKKGWLRPLSASMGWGAFAAGLFDSVENYALWHVLTTSAAAPYPQIAAVCATIKFILLIAGLLTALAGSLMRK